MELSIVKIAKSIVSVTSISKMIDTEAVIAQEAMRLDALFGFRRSEYGTFRLCCCLWQHGQAFLGFTMCLIVEVGI